MCLGKDTTPPNTVQTIPLQQLKYGLALNYFGSGSVTLTH